MTRYGFHASHEQIGPPISWDVETTEGFDALWQQWLAEQAELGFGEIHLHHVGQEQTAFIDAFGDKVLPELRKG